MNSIINRNVDIYLSELMANIRTDKYTLRTDEDPLFKILIEHEMKRRNMMFTYEQGETYTKLARSITQYSGMFWQKVLGNAPGWVDLKVGHHSKCDIVNEKRMIIMELKNKYNTMNSDSKSKVIDKLIHANKKGYSAVLGVINDKTDDGVSCYANNTMNVRYVTGAHLFELVYEQPDTRYLVLERIAALCDDTVRLAKYMARRIFGNIIRNEQKQEIDNDITDMMKNVTL